METQELKKKIAKAILKKTPKDDMILLTKNLSNEIAADIIELLDKEKIINAKFIPPTVQQAKDYLIKKELMNGSLAEIDAMAQKFISHYESVGWVVGKLKKPMQTWKKALNVWMKQPWNKPEKTASNLSKSIEGHLKIQQQVKNSKNG